MLEQACHAIQPLLSKNNNKLEVELERRAAHALFNDATKFRQIFINLLSNACKFTDDGKIVVRAELLAGRRALVLFEVEATPASA